VAFPSIQLPKSSSAAEIIARFNKINADTSSSTLNTLIDRVKDKKVDPVQAPYETQEPKDEKGKKDEEEGEGEKEEKEEKEHEEEADRTKWLIPLTAMSAKQVIARKPRRTLRKKNT
jgi:ABC-type Zn2+ transport system substrate-binding protein/surface adhesin